MSDLKFQRLDPLSPEALEELLNSAETGNGLWRVRTMTREEFERLYPSVVLDNPE